MKTTSLKKRPLWILLTLLASSKLCGQSLNATPKSKDSLAVAVEFIGHAKSIEMDLIRLDFAIKREVVYKDQISQQEATNQRQAKDLANCQASNGKLTAELTNTRQAVADQVIKTRQAKLEVWAMRLAVALYVAGKLKGILP
ncbi:hypothetical protein GCM10028807_17570 [Spirosoma daeguense]